MGGFFFKLPRKANRSMTALAVAMTAVQWDATQSRPPLTSREFGGAMSVLVRRWRGVSPDIEQPALDHHYVTLHLGGPKRVRRRCGGANTISDVAEGAYSVMPAGSACSWSTQGPIDFAHVYLKPAMLDNVIAAEFDRDPRQVSLKDVMGARDPLLGALLAGLVEAVGRKERASRLYWEGYLHTFVCRLLQVHSTLASVAAPAPHGLAPSRVRRVLEFVENHLADDIGLLDLAATAGVSPFHFTRGFRRATGATPYAFLTRRRLERAKSLLDDTELSLANVARACGFASHGQFSSMFKRGLGISPSRYRLRH